MGCQSSRLCYLASISSSALILNTTRLPTTNTELTSQFLDWVAKRQVKAREWVFQHDLELSLVVDFAERVGGPHVRTLSLNELKQVTEGKFCTVFLTCKGITQVSITNTEHWTGLSALRGEAERVLEGLSIVNCGTKAALQLKRHRFASLRRLCLVGDYTAATVNSLLSAAPNLVALRMRRTLVDEVGLQILANRANSLETLMLCDCSAISDSAVSTLTPACARLKTLSVAGCTQLTGGSIEAFAACCPLLECFQLTDRSTAGLSAIVQNRGATLLQLSLSGLKFESEDALMAVAQHCHNLQDLEYCNCKGVTSDCLVQLVSSELPLVRNLMLVGCKMSDAVLIAVATHLSKLEFLNLSASSGYTSNGALRLIRSLNHLRRFAVQPTHAVFNGVVLGLWKDRLPSLAVVSDNRCTPNCEKLYAWR
jgi:hypothetical protein